MKINVRVIPRASKERIIEEAGILKVYVRSVPEDNKANRDVVALIAERFGVKKRAVSIVKGAKSRNKVLEVLGSE